MGSGFIKFGKIGHSPAASYIFHEGDREIQTATFKHTSPDNIRRVKY